MAYQPGDVLLASIAFPDASGTKKRPVLVIHDFGDADLLLAPVTSRPARGSQDLVLRDWQRAGLRLPSTVRMSKLATIAKTAVVRKLDHLTDSDQRATRELLRRLLEGIIGYG